jgi:hypothetical protein
MAAPSSDGGESAASLEAMAAASGSDSASDAASSAGSVASDAEDEAGSRGRDATDHDIAQASQGRDRVIRPSNASSNGSSTAGRARGQSNSKAEPVATSQREPKANAEKDALASGDVGESGVNWGGMKAPARRGVEVQGQLAQRPSRGDRAGERDDDRVADVAVRPNATPWGWRNRGEAPPAPNPSPRAFDDETGEELAEGFTPLNPGDAGAGLEELALGSSGPSGPSTDPGNAGGGDPLAIEGQALFAQSLDSPDQGSETLASWSVVIESFDAQQGTASAQAGLDKVRTLGGLPEARLQRRGKALEIAVGSFASVDDPAAKSELNRIREMQIGGGTPFSQAVLMPPVRIGSGKAEWDLRSARKQFGRAAKYSLQMGVYTWEPGASEEAIAQARKAAEEAVKKLRGEGQQAFFYHGANSSSVTVGLFSAEDYDPKNAMNQSPQLLELRKNFPYNLQNGKGVRVRDPGKPQGDDSGWKFVPSVLVNVP